MKYPETPFEMTGLSKCRIGMKRILHVHLEQLSIALVALCMAQHIAVYLVAWADAETMHKIGPLKMIGGL